jgi:hypothetical protein
VNQHAGEDLLACMMIVDTIYQERSAHLTDARLEISVVKKGLVASLLTRLQQFYEPSLRVDGDLLLAWSVTRCLSQLRLSASASAQAAVHIHALLSALPVALLEEKLAGRMLAAELVRTLATHIASATHDETLYELFLAGSMRVFSLLERFPRSSFLVDASAAYLRATRSSAAFSKKVCTRARFTQCAAVLERNLVHPCEELRAATMELLIQFPATPWTTLVDEGGKAVAAVENAPASDILTRLRRIQQVKLTAVEGMCCVPDAQGSGAFLCVTE